MAASGKMVARQELYLQKGVVQEKHLHILLVSQII